MHPILDIAKVLGLPSDALIHYGEHMTKLRLQALPKARIRPAGKIILVSAINPTRSGEG
ncbi:formate--tetrahydrofolate ligase, partial [Nitrosomonas sp.]|uniref:formate--tetrahydrofolate ligase n=1 Tax=Nitrosomonas sp. TaxID=42353 RepID=UPI001D438F90|nr:formate--tetrahydrofolate ligase [Nitrosomonas sp.]